MNRAERRQYQRANKVIREFQEMTTNRALKEFKEMSK